MYKEMAGRAVGSLETSETGDLHATSDHTIYRLYAPSRYTEQINVG